MSLEDIHIWEASLRVERADLISTTMRFIVVRNVLIFAFRYFLPKQIKIWTVFCICRYMDVGHSRLIRSNTPRFSIQYPNKRSITNSWISVFVYLHSAYPRHFWATFFKQYLDKFRKLCCFGIWRVRVFRLESVTQFQNGGFLGKAENPMNANDVPL